MYKFSYLTETPSIQGQHQKSGACAIPASDFSYGCSMVTLFPLLSRSSWYLAKFGVCVGYPKKPSCVRAGWCSPAPGTLQDGHCPGPAGHTRRIFVSFLFPCRRTGVWSLWDVIWKPIVFGCSFHILPWKSCCVAHCGLLLWIIICLPSL